jgi:hypothetical protein
VGRRGSLGCGKYNIVLDLRMDSASLIWAGCLS